MLGNWSHKGQEAESKLSHPVFFFLFALFLSLLSCFSSSSYLSLFPFFPCCSPFPYLHFLLHSLASTLPPLHSTLPSFLLLPHCLLSPSLTIFLAIFLFFFLPFLSTLPIPLSFYPITFALPFCLVLPLSLPLFLPLPPFPPYHLFSLFSPSSSFIFLPLSTPSPPPLPTRGLSSQLCTLPFSREGDSHFRVLPTSLLAIGGEQDVRP